MPEGVIPMGDEPSLRKWDSRNRRLPQIRRACWEGTSKNPTRADARAG
jgi:hypothetical protein